MGHVSDGEPGKRKRDVDDAGGQPGRAQHVSASIQQGAPGYIHYLPRSTASHLNLIQGDSDTFADIIGLVAEYETVLDRHESLASSLGAKLTGPRLLRGIEKFFDGPIKTTALQHFSNPISWLDVVNFARSNPKDFTLTHKPDGSRWCQFVLKGAQVEIMEDDWRLVWSGALDRFPLDHPLEEDETAELATLDILEQRTSILYKKADEVAARARILNHRLGQRKQDIRRRRNAQDSSSPSSSSRFQPVNHTPRGANFAPSYDLHADLLQQFLAASSSPPPSRSTSVAGVSLTGLGQPSPSHNASHSQSHSQSQSLPHVPTGTSRYAGSVTDTTPQPALDSRAEAFRSLITQRTDQLGKGDVINPPCDRCRRLRVECVKHLTACSGCTKKHAKCSWKTVTEEEVKRLKREMGVKDCNDGDGEVEMHDAPETREARTHRLEDRHELGRTSGDRTPGTLGTDDGSRPPSRSENHVPATLEPSPVSLQRFDLISDRHRVNMVTGLVIGSDHGSRAPEFSQMGQGGSLMAPIISTAPSSAHRSTEGSVNASPS